MVEQVICNHQVGGSIPLASSSPTAGRYSSGQRGQTVNLLAIAYGGSNPSLPILSSIPIRQRAGVAQLVEHWPSKPIVAGSSPVSRFAAQLIGFRRLWGGTRQDKFPEIGRNAPVRCITNNSSERCRRWLNWHDWKSCVQATVPWVRIPLSPPLICSNALAMLSGEVAVP